MKAFEFRTKIKNGFIQIPRNYKKELGDTVKVIVLCEHKAKHKDMVDKLLEHPFKKDDFKPFSRDEIYERT